MQCLMQETGASNMDICCPPHQDAMLHNAQQAALIKVSTCRRRTPKNWRYAVVLVQRFLGACTKEKPSTSHSPSFGLEFSIVSLRSNSA
jgi:hypothetical protein